MSLGRTGILTMALGGPESLEEVESFLNRVRGGRPTPPELVAEFRERYRRIGGKSPLREVSTRQAQALEARLRAEGFDAQAYVGMRHGRPFILDALARLAADGFRRVVAFCLTPYYSQLSVGAYFRAVREALEERDIALEVAYVDRWNTAPGLAELFAERVQTRLETLAREGVPHPYVLFTAHSLPLRLRQEGDPYERQLTETLEAIKARLPPIPSAMAYQSAGRTDEPWLGPSLEEAIVDAAQRGEKTLLVVPFGFISDHLEILWDLDVEAKAFAARHGVRLVRTESPNADPVLIGAMAAAIRPRLIE